MDRSRREGHDSDGRQTQLALALVLPLQEGLQVLLQHGMGQGSTGGVDELRIQVEGAGGGSAGQLSATTRLEASLKDPAQL